GEVAVPSVVAAPGELAVDPYPETRRLANGVVLEADVRIEDVAQLVARVERHEEVAVAEREIARHRGPLAGGRTPGRGEEPLRVRDDAGAVAALDQIGSDQRRADSKTDDARGQVVRE